MREQMPVQGRWRGARAEHLLQYLTQEMLKKFGKPVQNGEDLRAISGFENQFAIRRKNRLRRPPNSSPNCGQKRKSWKNKSPQIAKTTIKRTLPIKSRCTCIPARMLAIVNDAFEAYLEGSAIRKHSLKTSNQHWPSLRKFWPRRTKQNTATGIRCSCTFG